MPLIQHLVSKIGHIVFAENVSGVLFLMFGIRSNLVWYEKVFGHIFTFFVYWHVYIYLVLGLIMGGE
jgi:hypothetical protein